MIDALSSFQIGKHLLMLSPLDLGLIAAVFVAAFTAVVAANDASHWRRGFRYWRARARKAEEHAEANLMTLQRRGRRIAELEAALETHSPG